MADMKEIFKAFAGRRVFITGHTGFKGSWLAFLLSEIGADVMGFALPPATSINHFELLNLDKKIKHVVGDIREHPCGQRIARYCALDTASLLLQSLFQWSSVDYWCEPRLQSLEPQRLLTIALQYL